MLDTGALIGIERNDRRVSGILQRVRARREPIVVPAGALAQAWRGGPRQARLAAFLRSPQCEVVALDEVAAKAVGVLCAQRGTTDVVDASIAVVARQRRLRVLTSDPDDLRRLDPAIDVVAV